MIKDAEFKAGDIVTFKPYEKSCECVVMEVTLGSFGDGMTIHKEPDDSIFYHLMGEAVSVTTGRSIVESKLFEPIILDFDVPYYLLRRIPKERREANKENYHWLMKQFTMTGDEVRKLSDAYDDKAFRYKVRGVGDSNL